MSTRRINGFCDESEFEVSNDIIRIIDNGPLYKNKLRNGLLLDTLCFMEFCRPCEEDIVYEKPLEKKLMKMNCIDEDEDNSKQDIKIFKEKNVRQGKNMRQGKNEKRINKKEQKRRNKRKLLKVGNDYKMRQYQDDEMKIHDIVKIPTKHFEKTNTDEYAPICTDCFIHTMLSKKYHTLYKDSYPTKFCNHIKCWLCIYKDINTYNIKECCCNKCYQNIQFEKYYYLPVYNIGYVKYLKYWELFNNNYCKKYKSREKYEFDFNTKINYKYYLDHNGNIKVEVFDEKINYVPISSEDVSKTIELIKSIYSNIEMEEYYDGYSTSDDSLYDYYDYRDHWD